MTTQTQPSTIAELVAQATIERKSTTHVEVDPAMQEWVNDINAKNGRGVFPPVTQLQVFDVKEQIAAAATVIGRSATVRQRPQEDGTVLLTVTIGDRRPGKPKASETNGSHPDS